MRKCWDSPPGILPSQLLNPGRGTNHHTAVLNTLSAPTCPSLAHASSPVTPEGRAVTPEGRGLHTHCDWLQVKGRYQTLQVQNCSGATFCIPVAYQ